MMKQVENLPAKIPTLLFEKHLWKAGFTRIAGIDEAGRGALAGPVCAAVVILPEAVQLTRTLHGVRDSKQMTPAERDQWAPRIKAAAITWGVGFASAAEIDNLGIVPSTKLAAERAIEFLIPPPEALLTDALLFPDLDLPQTALIKGDQRSLSVAAASVLAKTARDLLMRENETIYPGYGFGRHKGYGTPAHRTAVQQLGLCPIHRRSFTIRYP